MENDARVVGPDAPTASFISASPGRLDGGKGNVDLLHRHHRLEDPLRLIATSRKRIG